MPGTPTTKYGLPTMAGSDIINTIDEYTVSLTGVVDPLLTPSTQGALASRPVSTGGSPGKVGRTYFATDTGQLFRDNGTGWDEIPITPIGTADLAAASVTAAKIEAQQAWQTLSLLPSGWTGAPDGFARYYKDSLGIVRFSAYELVTPSTFTAAGTTLATLPAGYRPGAASMFPTSLYGGSTVTPWVLRISTAGVITVGVVGLSASSTISFGSISFRAE